MQQEKEVTLARSLSRLEDRLILVCLPVLILAMIIWAIGSTFPGISVVANLIVTVIVLLVYCIAAIRLVERIRALGMADPNGFFPPALAFIIFLFFITLGCMIFALMDAGKATGERSFLIALLLIGLILEYRFIILRHSEKRSL